MQNRTTVFYVDDNPKSSRLLASILEGSGFRGTTIHDPIEALSLCNQTAFDIAQPDYEMLGMTGAQLAQDIKFRMPTVPVVLITRNASPPAQELVFSDAHFGPGTSLDDMLWRIGALLHSSVAG